MTGSAFLLLSLLNSRRFPFSTCLFPFSVFHLLGRRSLSPRHDSRHSHHARQAGDRQYSSRATAAPPPAEPLERYSSSARYSSRHNRGASPPLSNRPVDDQGREHDAYVPPEAVPARRAREPDVVPMELDSDAKRRRTDVRSGDSTAARRPPVDSHYSQGRDGPSTSISPMSVTQTDQSRTYHPAFDAFLPYINTVSHLAPGIRRLCTSSHHRLSS